MNVVDIELSKLFLLPRLDKFKPGDRIVFDTLPGYRYAPVYANDSDRRAVLTVVNLLLAQNRALVFCCRMHNLAGAAYVARVVVGVRPGVNERLELALKRLVLPERYVSSEVMLHKERAKRQPSAPPIPRKFTGYL